MHRRKKLRQNLYQAEAKESEPVEHNIESKAVSSAPLPSNNDILNKIKKIKVGEGIKEENKGLDERLKKFANLKINP